MASVIIAGVGSYVPSKVLTNDDLSKVVDTTDEWIRTRSGIRERRIAAPDEACSDLAIKAATAALADAKINATDIDLLIVFEDEKSAHSSKHIVSPFLQRLWDAVLRVSHSIRTIHIYPALQSSVQH